MSITIDRKGLLDLIVEQQRHIDDIDRRLHELMLDRAARQDKINRAQETIKALGRDISTIEVVELKYQNLPIPLSSTKGQTVKAFIGVQFCTIMASKYDDMPVEKDAWVAVKSGKLKYSRTKMNIKKSEERISRDIDENGFEVVEYAEIAYIDADSYQKFYMQASNKWHDSALVRQGLKARLISDDDR